MRIIRSLLRIYRDLIRIIRRMLRIDRRIPLVNRNPVPNHQVKMEALPQPTELLTRARLLAFLSPLAA